MTASTASCASHRVLEMSAEKPAASGALQAFNHDLLGQALCLVDQHAGPTAPVFAGPVGAHLRHLIEHYEALVSGARVGVVNYDGRPRHRELETSPTLARGRLIALRQALQDWPAHTLDLPLQLIGVLGLEGAADSSVRSTLGRELAFLASHTVHHFALLAPHLQRHGLRMPPHFGKAPATVAHELSNPGATALHHAKDSPCLSQPPSD